MGVETSNKFDPFADRTARDIRNTLSEAFVTALGEMDPSEYLNAARKWQSLNLAQHYLRYIDTRLQRYDFVFKTIRTDQITDAFHRAVIIWNQNLFFEFHDHLEEIWHSASGDERQALKGLIKAAGVYIHLEQNHLPAARSLAMKAYDLLYQFAHCLPFIANYDTFLEKLKNCELAPPRLEFSPSHK